MAWGSQNEVAYQDTETNTCSLQQLIAQQESKFCPHQNTQSKQHQTIHSMVSEHSLINNQLTPLYVAEHQITPSKVLKLEATTPNSHEGWGLNSMYLLMRNNQDGLESQTSSRTQRQTLTASMNERAGISTSSALLHLSLPLQMLATESCLQENCQVCLLRDNTLLGRNTWWT